MDKATTCMFIISTMLWDMQENGEFEDGHLDLIEKREWVAGLAELASRLTDIAVKNLIEGLEEYDICKATVDWYLAGIGK